MSRGVRAVLRAAPAQTHPQLLIVPPPARHHNLEAISQRTFVHSVLLLNGDVSFLNETKSNFLIKAGIVFSDLIQGEKLSHPGCSREFVHARHGSILHILFHKKCCDIYSVLVHPCTTLVCPEGFKHCVLE